MHFSPCLATPHNLAGSCVQVYSAFVLACFHEWLFLGHGRWTGLLVQLLRHSRRFYQTETFQRRKVVHQALITTHWCVIGVWGFRHDIRGRGMMMYLAEVIFSLLVRSTELLLFIKVSGDHSLLLLTKSYSLPHLSTLQALSFLDLKGWDGQLSHFQLWKSYFLALLYFDQFTGEWLKITVAWLN